MKLFQTWKTAFSQLLRYYLSTIIVLLLLLQRQIIDKSFSKILCGSYDAFCTYIHLNKVPIIPNVDLCRGYMFYGLGAHVYANLNAAQIHKNGNNDRGCFNIKS